jgi:O-antigen ligase
MKNAVNRTHRLKLALVGAALFLLPLGNQLANIPLLLLLLSSPFLLQRKDLLNATRSSLAILPLLYFFLLAVSVLWTENPSGNFSRLETKMSLVLGPLLILAFSYNLKPGERSELIKWFVVGTALASVIALTIGTINYVGSDWNPLGDKGFFKSPLTYSRLSKPIMDPAYLSIYSGTSILLLLRKESKFSGVLKWGIVILLGVLIWFLQARAQIAFLFVIGLYHLIKGAFLSKVKWWVMLLIVGAAGLAVIFLPAGSFGRFNTVVNLNEEQSEPSHSSDRIIIWTSAVQCFVENPIIGSGFGDSNKDLQSKYKELGFEKGVRQHLNAHNQFLETAVTSGLLGLSVFVLWMLVYARKAWDFPRPAPIWIVLFFLFSMLSESMLERAWGVLFASIFLPFLLAETISHQNLSENRSDLDS